MYWQLNQKRHFYLDYCILHLDSITEFVDQAELRFLKGGLQWTGGEWPSEWQVKLNSFRLKSLKH